MNEKKSFYLFRHAESVTNTRPELVGGRSNESPLSKNGEEQAKKLGLFLKRQNLLPDVVFVSPAVRTRRTAELSLGVLGLDLEVRIADEVQELSQGAAEGCSREEVYTPEVKMIIDTLGKSFYFPHGESMNGVGQRMHEWIRSCTEELNPSEKNVFVYTHGGAITYLASRIENWSHPDTYAFQKRVQNTSMSEFTVNSDGEVVVNFLNKSTQDSLELPLEI